MLTRRKKRPLQRDESTLRDARLLVIATEGSDTEPLYFNAIDEKLGDSRVRLHVIPSDGGKSSPRHIFDNIDNYAATYEIGTGD